MNFTEENVRMVKKFIDIKRKGYYCSSSAVKDVYNSVFETNWKGTSCASCLRSKIQELENALRKWEAEQAKKAQEADVTNDKVVDTPQEKKEEEPQDVNNSKPHKAKRRKAK